MGHTLWTSMAHHVQPELCGVAALAELVIYDMCKTGLPLLELIRLECWQVWTCMHCCWLSACRSADADLLLLPGLHAAG